MQQYHDRFTSAPSQTSGKRNSAQREYADYVQIPDYFPVDVRKLSGLSLGASFRLMDREQRKIKVITTDKKQFLEVKILLEKSFYLLEPMWTFLCPGGITVETLFKFCSYKDYKHEKPSYVLHLDDDKGLDGEDEFDAISSPKLRDFRLISSYNEIVKKLQGAREWARSNTRDTQEVKLEARLGKKKWYSLPNDCTSEVMNLHDLEELICNSNTTPRMDAGINNDQLVEELKKELKSRYDVYRTVETCYIYLEEGKADQNKRKVNVQIMFNDGTAEILEIINGQRVAIFDILCLQRQHDFRLELWLKENMCKDDPLFENFKVEIFQDMVVKGVEEPTKIDNWMVQCIRHKTMTSYILENTYMVTVSLVEESTFDVKHEACKLASTKRQWEIELCNIQWESEFKKEVEMSTKVLADGSAINDALPTEICENDLRNMFKQLDTINSVLDSLAQSF